MYINGSLLTPCTTSKFLQLEHDVRHLDVLLVLILYRHLEDDILLMIRNGLLADRFHQLAQSTRFLSVIDAAMTMRHGDLLEPKPIFEFAGRVEAGVE